MPKFSAVFLILMTLAAQLPAGDWGKSIAQAGKLHRKGDLRAAEEQLLRTLMTAESFGPKDPRLAYTLDYLGTINMQMGDPAKAEPMFSRALKGFEASKGPDSEEALETAAKLAESFEARGRWEEAEPLYRRVAEARRGDAAQQATDLNNLGLSLDAQDRQSEALDYYSQALELRIKAFGSESPETAEILSNQARVFYMKGDSAKSEELFLKALAIDEKALGPGHVQVAEDCLRLAPLYRKLGRDAEALKLEERAKAIKVGAGPRARPPRARPPRPTVKKKAKP